jgi:multidrug efflux pump subunit AcrA (membrane-fusion protein)
MKRFLPLVIVAIAAALFWFREQWLPAAADHNSYLGYVEGETTLLGASVAGRLVTVSAVKGKTVAQGDAVFALDDAAATAEVARLAAAVETAKATAHNLLSGKREAELDLIARQQAEAEANLDLARIEYARASTLNQRGISAETQFDRAKAALAVAEAKLAQSKASADVARLAARDDEIAAARSRIAEAEAAHAAAVARLRDYQGTAPHAASLMMSFSMPVNMSVPDRRSCLCCDRRISRCAFSFRKRTAPRRWAAPSCIIPAMAVARVAQPASPMLRPHQNIPRPSFTPPRRGPSWCFVSRRGQ